MTTYKPSITHAQLTDLINSILHTGHNGYTVALRATRLLTNAPISNAQKFVDAVKAGKLTQAAAMETPRFALIDGMEFDERGNARIK